MRPADGRGCMAFLDTLQRVYGAAGILTDEHGHDLLTGQDRSTWCAGPPAAAGVPFLRVRRWHSGAHCR